jgi:hypothetical protein
MTKQDPKYRQTLVDRDGFVLVAFTVFSLLLLGFSIYMSNGPISSRGQEPLESQSSYAP